MLAGSDGCSTHHPTARWTTCRRCRPMRSWMQLPDALCSAPSAQHLHEPLHPFGRNQNPGLTSGAGAVRPSTKWSGRTVQIGFAKPFPRFCGHFAVVQTIQTQSSLLRRHQSALRLSARRTIVDGSTPSARASRTNRA
jgi:hypothetical protein